MSFTVEPFRLEHVTQNEWMGESPLSCLSNEVLQNMSHNDRGFTAKVDGKVVAVAGILLLWPGVAHAYSYLTVHSKTAYKFSLHKSVNRGITTLQQLNNLHRLETLVELGYENGYRWVEALGFTCEGPLLNYTTDKKSFMRFARLWE
jgi:hypothetical protein